MPRVVSLSNRQSITNNPTAGISFGNLSNLQSILTNIPNLTVQAIEELINTLLGYIDDVTGLNLVAFATNLETLFGDLNPLSFNPAGAIETFFEIIVDVWDDVASGVISDIVGLFTGGVSDDIFNDLITLLVGSGSSLVGETGLGSILTDLLSLLGSPLGLGTGFPTVGLLGGDIVTGVQSLVDSLAQGFGDITSTGNSFADVGNIATGLVSFVDNIFGIATTSQAYVNMMPINMPGYHAVDPSLSGVFNITSITGTSASTISVIQTASVIGMIQIPATATKATVVWQGFGVTNLSAAYLNLYSVNTTTGALTKQYSSANIISFMGSALQWNYVPISTPVSVTQGSWYAAELQVVGTGTHTMVGLPSHWMPANPAVFPQQLGATRTTGLFNTIAEGAAAGTTSGSGSVSSLSWTHTPGATDNGVIVNVGAQCTGSTNPTISSVTYGGTAMTSNGSVEVDNTAGATLSAYKLTGIPTNTAKTVVVTFSSTLPLVAAAESVSYSNVDSFGTAQTTFGSGTALSQSVTALTGEMICQAFLHGNQTGTAGTLGSYNQTSLSNVNPADGTTSGIILLVGDAAGAATVSFTATASASHFWAALAIPILPSVAAAPSTISSPTYSQNVPWLALSSEVAGTSPTFLPQTTTFGTSGTYTAPTWANFIDQVGVGPGGSGQGELGPNQGQGGFGGSWNGATLVAGTDFTPGTTVFTVTPGAGPGGVGFFSNGFAGAATTITWTDPSSTPRTFTCAAGAGGSGTGLNYDGSGPGNFTWNSVTYFGGGTAGPNIGGNFPGGGGGGAVVFSPSSGPGAGGEAFIVARQS